MSALRNGQEALDNIRRNDYDLAFMDIQMPVMDGIRVTTTVRSMPDSKYQNLIILAMNDHITKPIIPTELENKARFWLGRC